MHKTTHIKLRAIQTAKNDQLTVRYERNIAMAEIFTIDWTDAEYVSQYLDVYGDKFDAIVPQQLDRIGDLTGKTFVDLGCGQGTLLIEAAATAEKCIGIDISPKMCDVVRDKANAAALLNVCVDCSTFLDWTVAPESVDIIWSRAAIHHLPDDQKKELFAAIHKALRPGGRFLMDDVMFEFGYGEYDDRLPAIAETLLKDILVPEKKTIQERDILSTFYKEYPSPAVVLKKLLEAAEFENVLLCQHTPFFGGIEAKK